MGTSALKTMRNILIIQEFPAFIVVSGTKKIIRH